MVQLLLALLLWTAYNIAVAKTHGIQTSLSATYYTPLGRKLLVPMLLAVVVLLLTVAFDSVNTDSQFAVFLSLFGLALVALAPLSRDDFEGQVHLVGAIVSGIGTQIVVLMNNAWYLLLWGLLLIPTLCDRRNLLFWSEMIMFYATALLLLALVV